MCKQTASLAAIIGLAVTIACNGADREVLAPTPFGTGFPAVGIHPSAVTVQSIGHPACPALPPFVGSLKLTVRAAGDLRVSLGHVRMTFTDSLGLTAPAVTLPGPVLTRQFGSTLIEARSQRTFPLTFSFGCATSRTGTLVVVVVLRDEKGREITAEARAAVR